MTFIEAALEILRREGVPLHAKVIAEKAVDAEILSHVGKTPLQTMSKRISAAVAKGKGPFVRVKPGVFALEDWKDDKGSLTPPGRRRHHDAEVRSALKSESQKDRKQTSANRDPAGASVAESPVAPVSADVPRRVDDEESGDTSGNRGRRSRSRRSRNRNREREPRQPERRAGDASKSETPPPQESASVENTVERSPGGDRRNDKRSTAPNEGDRGPITREDNGKSKPGGNGNNRSSSMPVERSRSEKGTRVAVEVERFLRQQNQPQSSRALADRIRIPGGNAETVLDALLDADNRERRANGRRARFVKHRNGWALSAREMPSEVVQIEEEIFAGANRLEQVAERQLQRRLKSLSPVKLTQLIILVLRQMGYNEVEPVARGRGSECHLRVTDRRQGGRFSTAVVIRNDPKGRGVNDGDVTDLRGALHHYKASRGLIITTGEILPEGFREADIPNLPPVGFIDGKMLAQEFVRCAIGVEKRTVQLTFLDESWF